VGPSPSFQPAVLFVTTNGGFIPGAKVALFPIVDQLCGMVLMDTGSVRISGLHVKQEIVNIVIQKVQAMGKTT